MIAELKEKMLSDSEEELSDDIPYTPISKPKTAAFGFINTISATSHQADTFDQISQ